MANGRTRADAPTPGPRAGNGRLIAGVALVTVLAALAAGCAGETAVRAGDASTPGPARTTQPSGRDDDTADDTADDTPDSGAPPRPSPPPTRVPTSPPPTTATIPEGTPEAGLGLGDEPYPELGAPAVDVRHYDVDLAWDDATDTIDARVAMTFSVTAPRDDVPFDATDAVQIGTVTLDGAPVDFVHDASELVVTPAVPLVPGAVHEVVVEYRVEPTGSEQFGWLLSANGPYTLNEPDFARTWLPSNDHPSDKATWRFAIEVADGLTAVANGDLVARGDGRGTGTDTDTGTGAGTGTGTDVFVWEVDEPMATYLVQVLIGPYDLIEGQAGDLELSSAVLREDVARVRPYVDAVPEMVEWFEGFFGPYPFASYGLAVADSYAGLAMEHQTRSLFPRTMFGDYPEEVIQDFLAHELAHQWFGDAVSPASWQDIWLNEGFATYGQWMWADHLGYRALDVSAESALATPRTIAPDAPGDDLFVSEVYEGGATVLHALRRTVGDASFFEILRRWVGDNDGASRTTDDFIALAEEVSGQPLDEFFATWLSTTDPPSQYP